MTPELSAMIKRAVGEDVETEGLAVFETIALNTLPLPGKRGTIFERAVVAPVTLAQMVDSINSGNHLPLIADHELFGAPKGRFFHAGLNVDENGVLEMRALFYLDATEQLLITKLNAGSLDEVSVAFLSSSFLCSECGWDYFQFGSDLNIDTRTCVHGHTIGTDGVHANMIGLNQFIELSLVARGAANTPKIVGKSQAKLAPESTYRLAASFSKPDALVVQASMRNKEDTMDLTAALSQVATLSVDKGQLTANLAAAERERDARGADVTRLTTELSTATAEVARLTADLATASTRPEASVATERDAAVTFLHEQLDHLMVAKGEAKLEGEARLKDVASLKTKIAELTANLTSILPVEGVSVRAGGTGKDEGVKLSFNPAAFTVRK